MYIQYTQLYTLYTSGEGQSEEAASLAGAGEQSGVRCLAQGLLGRAQEVNWHLSSYQCFGRPGLEPVTLQSQGQVPTD